MVLELLAQVGRFILDSILSVRTVLLEQCVKYNAEYEGLQELAFKLRSIPAVSEGRGLKGMCS
jgi:hypothetical protein